MNFNDTYWASFAPEIQALRELPTDSLAALEERIARGRELAFRGFLIEPETHLRGFDPLGVMEERKEVGLTWVPDILHPNVGQPGGYAMPGQAPVPGEIGPYPSEMPAWGLKVSTDEADYPPFVHPVIEPAPEPRSPVGFALGGGNLYAANLPEALGYPGGTTCESDPRGRFLSRVLLREGGVRVQYFVKLA